jgi:hypothetical protein
MALSLLLRLRSATAAMTVAALLNVLYLLKPPIDDVVRIEIK